MKGGIFIIKLNPDSIRDVLLQTEQGPFQILNLMYQSEETFENLDFLQKYPYNEVEYHIHQCELMNFISLSRTNGFIFISDLNPEGHSFLANNKR